MAAMCVIGVASDRRRDRDDSGSENPGSAEELGQQQTSLHLRSTIRRPLSITRHRTRTSLSASPEDGASAIPVRGGGRHEDPLQHASSQSITAQKVSSAQKMNFFCFPFDFHTSLLWLLPFSFHLLGADEMCPLRHVLNCIVHNEPGLLSRVSGILASRGFNIDSLAMCRAEIRDPCRMCIVISGEGDIIEQALRQLEDLVRFPSSRPQHFLRTIPRRCRCGPC